MAAARAVAKFDPPKFPSTIAACGEFRVVKRRAVIGERDPKLGELLSHGKIIKARICAEDGDVACVVLDALECLEPTLPDCIYQDKEHLCKHEERLAGTSHQFERDKVWRKHLHKPLWTGAWVVPLIADEEGVYQKRL
ncbi:hypothetical protein LQW54_012581 [Pestalotiopsis sp. IQ-011]